MTNLEYIIGAMRERDVACFVMDEIPIKKVESELQKRAWRAFSKWQEGLKRNRGNVWYVNEPFEENPSVFQASHLHFYDNKENRQKLGTSKDSNYAMARETVVSMELWLSKQYRAEEWQEESD